MHEHGHSRYPVIGTSFDDVTGFLHVRDLLDVGLATTLHGQGYLIDAVRLDAELTRTIGMGLRMKALRTLRPSGV